MTFDEYQKRAKTTTEYSDYVEPWVYLTLGLAGETGEVVDKLKKIVRNHHGQFTPEAKTEIQKELGDVLWYISQLCEELGFSMQSVADANLSKLSDRKSRDAIRSQGDNR